MQSDWKCYDINKNLSTLPQARVNQRDVIVTPPNHDVFNVGGSSELCSQLAIALHEHNKPFEMDTKVEERRHFI